MFNLIAAISDLIKCFFSLTLGILLVLQIRQKTKVLSKARIQRQDSKLLQKQIHYTNVFAQDDTAWSNDRILGISWNT